MFIPVESRILIVHYLKAQDAITFHTEPTLYQQNIAYKESKRIQKYIQI